MATSLHSQTMEKERRDVVAKEKYQNISISAEMEMFWPS